MSEVELHNALFNEKSNELDVLPVRMGDTVTVFIDFSVQAIYDLDEKHEKLSISGYLELFPRNSFFVWNPRRYRDAEQILVKSENTLLPDLQVVNIIGDEMDMKIKQISHYLSQ